MPIIFFIALWAGRAVAAVCSNNTVPPLALPITDVLVDPDIPNSLMRGIPARIGTPPQDIVVLPWPDLNNTYIYDQQPNCDSTIIWNDRICGIRRGGLFREGESTSFSKASELAAVGATQEITTQGTELGVSKLLSTSLGGTDRFAAGARDSTSNFTTMPIGIPRLRWDNGYTMLHALGLGSNSTYLNALVAAGMIPSRVWSLFWGRMWTGNDVDGSVVLGGYDQAKVIGNNVTQPLDYSEDTGCWTGMKVTVTNVVVNFRNGTDYGIMARNTAVQCCLVPQRQLLWEGPGDIVSAFTRAAGMPKSTGPSYGLHWGAQQYNASNAIFDGDVTFSLSSGLQVRIPNSQLITPFVDIDRNGSRTVNQSRRELLLENTGRRASVFGRYFFTSAYLMVDHDAHTFTMWQANPSTKTNLIPVVSKSTTDKGCEPGEGGGGSEGAGGGNTGDSTATDETASKTVGAGVIAGAAVGGAAFLAIVAGLIFWLLKRKKKQTLAAPAAPPAEPYWDQPQGQHEIYTKMDNPLPAEVPENGVHHQELHGTSVFNHGHAAGGADAWPLNAGPGQWSPARPGDRHELDGGWMPHEVRN